MKAPDRLLSLLRQENRFVISAHVNPDGDAIGSTLALSLVLESMGKEALVYSRDSIPRQYEFLPATGRITDRMSQEIAGGSVLVLMDCNMPERAGLESYRYRHSVVIDHHETKSDFGDIAWIESGAAATGLMVYAIIKALGLNITKEIAYNLYTAISIDTGTFRYGNTSAEVLSAAAELVASGADPEIIAGHLYEKWDLSRFRLLVETLNNLDVEDGVAVCHVSDEMIKETGARPEDTENFANIAKVIDSVKISMLLREMPGGVWKVSLRSKGEFDVSGIAQQFGGGGHKNAAGFQIRADLHRAKSALLEKVREKHFSK